MIYWDNAATTWPKPASVRRAVGQALEKYGANPGRAGHQMAMETAEMVFDCRQAIADFFGLSDPSGVIFTSNCTMSLNMVIQSVVGVEGRVLTSDLEHNAVVRPLSALSLEQARYDVASWSPDPHITLENFRRSIRPNTKLLLCTHASNVFGSVLPIRDLGELAHRHGVLFCVDAAQTAGVLPLHMERDHIDFLCIAPHKGLYAPMGTGLLLCRKASPLLPLVRGGTGSYSLLPEQPEELPDRLESGTLNVPGIAGIRAGIKFVKEKSSERIYQHEIKCLQRVYQCLYECDMIQMYTPYPILGRTAPVLALNVVDAHSEEIASLLNEHRIAVRAGLQCAPWAHRRFGTLQQGVVRLSASAFSSEEEAVYVAKVFLQIAQKSLHRQKNMI